MPLDLDQSSPTEAVLPDPRYDVRFEPMAIGPVTAKNRSYPNIGDALPFRREFTGPVFNGDF